VREAQQIVRLDPPTAELVKTDEIKDLAEGLRRAKAAANGSEAKPQRSKPRPSATEHRMLEADEPHERMASPKGAQR
jgi:hypothetical protein